MIVLAEMVSLIVSLLERRKSYLGSVHLRKCPTNFSLSTAFECAIGESDKLKFAGHR